jgi:DNA modification methylase
VTPFFHDDHLTVYQGDCREVMAAMEPESVHCVVTSPPYWGLRDYGTATWVGGDEGCDHKETVARHDGGRSRVDGFNGSARADSDKGAMNFRDACGKCGAVRQDSQLGLEPTPEAFVANMVAVFREVRRVLRKDGTLWLNLGDSYATQGAGAAYGWTNGKTSERDKETMSAYKAGALPPGLKPKDLVGIPWRVAFALQADGWYLRSDIIWAKPNPMPESVTDRPTKAHEYLFLLTKSPRYYYDADAVREPSTNQQGASARFYRPTGNSRGIADGRANHGGSETAYVERSDNGGRNLRSVWNIATAPYGMVTPESAYADGPLDTVSPDCPVHSLRAIRRTRQTVGDGGLLDHLRPRNRGTASRHGQAPDDGLFASSDLDSPDDRPAMPGSALPRSSAEPTPRSTPESRSSDLATDGDVPALTAGTSSRTSRTPSGSTSSALSAGHRGSRSSNEQPAWTGTPRSAATTASSTATGRERTWTWTE